MATFTTLRASSKFGDDGFISSPSGSLLSVTTDSTDSTYIKKPASNYAYAVSFYVANPSPSVPAAGSFLAGQRLRCRISQGSGGNLLLLQSTSYGGESYETSSIKAGTVALPSTIATVSSASRASTGIITVTTAAAHGLAVDDLILIQNGTGGTPSAFINATYRVLTTPTGTTFTAQDIRGAQTASTVNATNGNISAATNADSGWLSVATQPSTGSIPQTLANNAMFLLMDTGTSAGRSSIYEAYCEMWSSPIPTVSLAAIDGDSVAAFTVTSTSRPLVEWTYAQADSFAQSKYRVKVFTSSQADPDNPTGTPVYDSGIVTSSSSSDTISTDLINGTTYYLYIKVGTSGLQTDTSSNADESVAWSLWLGNTFTTSYTAPPAPTVSASWNTSPQTVSLTLTGGAVTAPMTAQTFDVQRSDDGGATWVFVRAGMSMAPNGSYIATLTDHEAARGVTVRYRARSVATGGGNTIASVWSTVATVAVPALSVWLMRALSATTQIALADDVKVLSDLPLTQEENVGVFRPRGRTTPVVVHGDIQGEDGQYNILCTTQAKFDALIAVVNSKATILIADPFGESKYVRFISRSWNKAGAAASPRYEVSVSYVEVASGLTAG